MTSRHCLPTLRPTRASSAVLCAALALSGCATVQSDYKAGTTALDPSSAGVTYFLPRKLIKVTASSEPVDLADLTETRDEAAATLAAATKALGVAKKAAAHATAVFDAMAADAAGRDGRQAARDVAKAEVQVAASVLSGAKSDHAKAAADLRNARQGGCTYSAKIELMPAQPDLNHRFVARVRHNWMRDDTIKLKVTAAGLLSSTNVVAADRTGDIIAEAAGAVSGLGGGPGRTSASVTPIDDCKPKTVVQILDPTNEAEVNEAKKALAGMKFGLNVQAGDKPDDEKAKEVAASFSRSRQGALFYRSPAPMKIWLTRTDTGGEYIADASIVMVPQAGPIGFVPLNSSVFVKTVDDVQFVDGVIAEWDTDRPSEVLEIVRLPVKVAKSIISVPAELLSLKVDYSSNAKALAEAQKAEIENKRLLLKLKTCLAAADATGASADSCLVAGS